MFVSTAGRTNKYGGRACPAPKEDKRCPAISAASLISALLLLLNLALARAAEFKTRVYLDLQEAPRAIFPEADDFEQHQIKVTPELGRRIKELVGRARPTIWEPFYYAFVAKRRGAIIGYAVVCEEIGKHRAITFIVGATPDARVRDVAVMAYREPIGDEVRYRGFLDQFKGKSLDDPIMPYRDISNISGATLSVRALSRGVRKGLAVIRAHYLEGRGAGASGIGLEKKPALSGAADGLVVRSHFLMGTVWEIAAHGARRDVLVRAIEEAFAEIRRADELMSNYREESELSQLNRRAARERVRVSNDLYQLLCEAARIGRLTGGAFDITVAPLLRAWGFLGGRPRVPSEREIAERLEKVGWPLLGLDDEQKSVSFALSGMELDLGGIAKGWAVDRAAEALARRGVAGALISAGSSTFYAYRRDPRGRPWRVLVRSPLAEGELLAVADLEDESLSTSGGYGKFFEAGGRRYCHIIDPRSGKPVQGMLSATVLAPRAVESDALSTALFVMGLEEGKEFLARRGLSGLLVSGEPRGPARTGLVGGRIAILSPGGRDGE